VDDDDWVSACRSLKLKDKQIETVVGRLELSV